MKRLAGSLALLALAACPNKGGEDAGVDAGPRVVAEKEPNDRFEQAQILSEPSIVNAELGSDPAKPDDDWFALDAQSGKAIDVRISGIPAADVALELYDPDR